MAKMPEAVLSGRTLFYAIWQKVQDQFYDPARLEALNWKSLKHAFDDRLLDDASAIDCAGELLALLNEKYTKILPPVEVSAKAARRTSEELHARNLVLPGNIGYIGIASFDHQDIVEQVRERLEGIAHCDAFIVNLRENGGGLINETANVLELFIDEGEIGFIEKRRRKKLQERFIFFTHEHFGVYQEMTGKKPSKDLFLRKASMIAGKPMIILIDEHTASSAELFAAALLANGKDGWIIAMGRKTCGKGIGQADFNILGKVTLKLSCLRFMSPDQVWFGDAAQTVNNGIEPHVAFPSDGDMDEEIELARTMLLAKVREGRAACAA